MSIRIVGIIGSGTMGSGIAQVSAAAGLQVVLVDISDAALAKGLGSISGNLERLVGKGKLDDAARKSTFDRISTSCDYGALRSCDLVIEAATENPATKNAILRQLDAVLPSETVIASNTSSISITALAAVVRNPSRFIGLHFFNPVPVMSLVEIIRGLQTSDVTQARVEAFAHGIGKTAVSVKNSAGFAVNRILCPMINEAIFVLQEGIASADDIDTSMKLGCNQPIGPLALADMIGLDTLLAIMSVLQEGLGDPKYRPAPLLREMVSAGRLGRKSGEGFFRYT